MSGRQVIPRRAREPEPECDQRRLSVFSLGEEPGDGWQKLETIGVSEKGESRTPPSSYRLPAVDFALTDEQSDFVDAIRDFCDRECGTQDQRERLTDGYKEHHSFDLYKKMAELGWLGVTGARGGRCSRPVSSWRRPRAGWPRSAATRRR